MMNYGKDKELAIIPTVYIKKQKELNLSDAELLALIKLMAIDEESGNLLNFLNEYSISREVLSGLDQKGIISLVKSQGKLQVVLNEMQVKAESEIAQVLVSSEMIDRINFLLNRQLRENELEKIKTWIELEYSMNEIESAITKSILNNVDNFNYIEKVLFNNQGSTKPKSINIERNFELY